MDQFNTLLALHRLRSTSARREVFEILLTADRPLSIADITKAITIADRTSVYRTIQLFISLSIVEAIPFGWKTRYELAGDFKPHHHHLICSACGTSISIKPSALEHLVSAVARKHQFISSSHHFEIYGVCKSCQFKTSK